MHDSVTSSPSSVPVIVRSPSLALAIACTCHRAPSSSLSHCRHPAHVARFCQLKNAASDPSFPLPKPFPNSRVGFPPTLHHSGRTLPVAAGHIPPRSSGRRHADCSNILVQSHSYLAIRPGLQCVGSYSGGFLSPASRLNAGAIDNGSCVGATCVYVQRQWKAVLHRVREDDGGRRYSTREDDGRWRCTIRVRTAKGGTALCAMGRMDDDTHRISRRCGDSFTSGLMKLRSKNMLDTKARVWRCSQNKPASGESSLR